jgi:hypothetical protein
VISSKASRLFELMQSISFGRIESLHIRAGEPVFDPPPRILREIKLASPDQQSSHSDYLNKPQVRELLEIFRQVGDGVIDVLEIRHSLPFKVTFSDQLVGKKA